MSVWRLDCQAYYFISGTLDGLSELDEVRCDRSHVHGKSQGRNAAGVFHTRRLQTYPPLFAKAIAERIFRTLCRFVSTGTGPTGWERDYDKVVRVTSWGARHLGSFQSSCTILNEDAITGRHVIIENNQAAFYLHVDDGIIITDRQEDPPECNRIMEHLADALEAIGFVVKDRTHDDKLTRIIGYEPERSPARLRLPLRKRVLLTEAMQWAVNRRWIDTALLHSLLGMWLHGALLKRELLSIPSSLFQIIERTRSKL
jgi:hypothetical protein